VRRPRHLPKLIRSKCMYLSAGIEGDIFRSRIVAHNFPEPKGEKLDDHNNIMSIRTLPHDPLRSSAVKTMATNVAAFGCDDAIYLNVSIFLWGNRCRRKSAIRWNVTVTHTPVDTSFEVCTAVFAWWPINNMYNNMLPMFTGLSSIDRINRMLK
jgi:hypothetical protein